MFVVFRQEEEETELAVICLQKLLRGRAVQNMVFCVSLGLSSEWWWEGLKACLQSFQPKFLTGTSRFLHMSLSVSLFLPFPTLSYLISCFIAELLKWQILD